MSLDGKQNLSRPEENICRQSACWATIPIEIRLQIWGLAYILQGPRLVEVRIAEHDHFLGSLPCRCPRYSLSPAPNVINICRESRDEVQGIAEAAGHLIFDAVPDAPKIYFNPDKDILYVPNERNHWIRDWGPEGIVTELKRDYQTDRLRSLAIGLEPDFKPITHSAPFSLVQDLHNFPQLEDVIFVTETVQEEVLKWVRLMDARLFIWTQQLGVVLREPSRPLPKEFKLAILRAGRLEIIKKEKNSRPI